MRGRKLRVDTTAVESDIGYPTDADLLADGIATITREVKKLTKSGQIEGTFRDRTRSTKYRLLEIAKQVKRRTGDKVAEVRAITRKIMKTAAEVVSEAEQVIGNTGHQALRNAINTTKKIITQTQHVEEGQGIKDRIVSLVDEDARPICRGKRETEFGYKAILTETEERIIIDRECFIGNPNDNTLLEDTLIRSKEKLGRAPRAVATDRGFGSEANDTICANLGIKKVSIPRKGKLSSGACALQDKQGFKQSCRTGTIHHGAGGSFAKKFHFYVLWSGSSKAASLRRGLSASL